MWGPEEKLKDLRDYARLISQSFDIQISGDQFGVWILLDSYPIPGVIEKIKLCRAGYGHVRAVLNDWKRMTEYYPFMKPPV